MYHAGRQRVCLYLVPYYETSMFPIKMYLAASDRGESVIKELSPPLQKDFHDFYLGSESRRHHHATLNETASLNSHLTVTSTNP